LKKKMKISERWVGGLLILILSSLPIGRGVAQNAASASTSVSSVALCSPLKTDEATFSRLSSSYPRTEDESELWWSVIRETLEGQQTLSDGRPYPEAVSLARVMEASLRSGARIGKMISIDTDAMKPLKTEPSAASALQAKTFQDVDALVFMLYTFQDTTIRCGALLLTRAGESASYFSGPLSIFGLVEGTQEAVSAFTAKKLLEPPAQATSGSLAPRQSSAPSTELPTIEPWKDRPRYEQANSRFQFSIGGVVAGLSASVVSLGLWQAYREAAYRNTAYEGAMNASAVLTGACVAVTAAFLTSAVWNVVLMLQASH
jgi:hypothetical protein